MPLPRVRVYCNGHRHDGAPCPNPAVKGKTKCRQHGGQSLSGIANGNYKHGRYSTVLPARLAQRYEEARTNPRLLSLADDLAACESRLADLFQRVDSGESGAVWKQLGSTLDAFNTAMGQNDLAAMRTQLATLRQLITQGRDDYQAWHEIQSLWETRCKLTLAEVKTLATAQQMISTEQLLVYMGVITDAIQRTVTAHADPGVARTILGDLSAEFGRLTVLETR